MKTAFVVSDIHGMHEQFLKLLTNWNHKEQYLVILGDLIDRGPHSLQVVLYVKLLKSKFGDQVIVLQGNHDQMINDFVDNPIEAGQLYVCHNGGVPTLSSFSGLGSEMYYKSHPEIAEIIKENCSDELNFLKQGHLFYEFGKVLFTHAGFCSWAKCWEETTDEQFVWIRDHYKHKNNSGFVNVFGHTPTQLINKDKSNDVWVSDDKLYIGIDGACAYGGQLNAALISEDGTLLETYSVSNNQTVK